MLFFSINIFSFTPVSLGEMCLINRFIQITLRVANAKVCHHILNCFYIESITGRNLLHSTDMNALLLQMIMNVFE